MIIGYRAKLQSATVLSTANFSWYVVLPVVLAAFSADARACQNDMAPVRSRHFMRDRQITVGRSHKAVDSFLVGSANGWQTKLAGHEKGPSVVHARPFRQ